MVVVAPTIDERTCAELALLLMEALLTAVAVGGVLKFTVTVADGEPMPFESVTV